MKDDTNDTIKQLNEAELGVKMITGDNILTAVNVAFECNIINKNKEIIILDLDE